MRLVKLLTVACRVLRFAWLAFALSVTRIPAAAMELPSDAEIKTILQNFIERDRWGVGMVVGIVDEHGTRIISYGKLDNGDSPEVNGDTLFEIGSITKTFTCLLLQDMVSRGEMKLDDPVEKFLPASVKVPDWDGRKITLLDLATHTSGLPREMKEWTVPAMYDFISHCKLLSKPGTKACYSNFGVCLLAHVIELRADTNFEALVQERICRPLNMDSTCIKPTPELRPRWAKSHGDENRAVWDMDAFYSGLGGAGAIRSSANDMLKYVAAEIGLTNSPLTPLMEQTHAVRFPHAFGKAGLAMPWWVYHRDGAELITHGGSTRGHKAFIGFDKKLKRGVVVLANRHDSFEQAVEPLGMDLLQPKTDPPPLNVASEILDAYVGIYKFPAQPGILLTIRRDGDALLTQLLDAVAFKWIAQSKTEFVPERGGPRMKFGRNLLGRMKVSFFGDDGTVSHCSKVSDGVPDSLFQPMLQPLTAAEYAPQKDSDLQGTWKGTIRPWYWPFISRRGTLNIAERAPGFFCAELNVPAERMEKLPIAVIYHPPGVELVIKSGDGMFKGRINTAHTKMTGHLIQGKRSIGVTLRRADP